MGEILPSCEQVAIRVSPAVLILPGLAMVLLGLVLWLAGVCRRRLLLGLAGALLGGLVGFFVGRQNPMAAVLVAGGVAACGAIVPRVFAAAMMGILGTVIAFAVVARVHVFQQQGPLPAGGNPHPAVSRLTVQESLDAVQVYILGVGDWLSAIARGLVSIDLAIIAAVGGGLLILGLIFRRLAGALTCSTIGAGLLFAGLTLLLIFKGSAPVARMEQQGPFYGLVLLGLIAFGTLEQLLLCPHKEGRGASSGRSRNNEEDSKQSWRNR